MIHTPQFSKLSGNLLLCVLVVSVTAGLALVSDDVNSQTLTSEGRAFYIKADTEAGGDGSQQRPFSTLAEAETASTPGDTLFLMANTTGRLIDGGIVLKSGQKLLGIDHNGRIIENETSRVQLTNTTDYLEGIVIKLADNNEIGGIHIRDIRNYAISGAETDFSGTFIHHTSYSGHANAHIEDERGLVYAVSLDANEGLLNNIRIEDSTFRDGEDLDGIRVFQSGNSSGNYHFRNNHFTNLGGRAYFVQTRGSSKVETVILDSSADNIGRGERNSDSIIPYLMGQSEQIMLVRNYHYKNSRQVGSQSNTGIEAFIFGSPRPDRANWCDGCRLTLKIMDSVIENAVTDPIQFSNSGINSDLSYEVRNTRVIGGNPRQGGGGISLNMQTVPSSGTRTSLLVENSDIIGTTGFGFAFNNRAGGDRGFQTIIDLGGGALGSLGNNRFIDNDRGDMRIPSNSIRITAQSNWWNGEITVFDSENQPLQNTSVEFQPALHSDPRPLQ